MNLKITKRLTALVLSGALLLSACDENSEGGGIVNDSRNAESSAKNETGGSAETIQNDGGGETGELSAFPYEFTATDAYGNTVTQEDLGEKKVYFVHYWATWCPPCIDEMPELAAIADEYGDRVGFIGLIDDYEDNLSGAVEVIESAGFPESFVMIDANEPSAAKLAKTVQSGYLPTTVIIAGGEVVSEQITGAQGEKYTEYLDKFLAQT